MSGMPERARTSSRLPAVGACGSLARLNAWFTNILHLPLNTSFDRRAAMAKLNWYLGRAALAAASGSALPAAAGRRHRGHMNQAKIVKLSRRPTRSSSAIRRSRTPRCRMQTTVVLTGKGFGVTNLVILDETEPDRRRAGDGRAANRHPRCGSTAAPNPDLVVHALCESSFKSEAERTSEAEMSASQ